MNLFNREDCINYLMEEDGLTREEAEKFMQDENEKELKSYEGTEARPRYCLWCSQVLRYNSISYHEGFHIDSCL